jgi:hypothetical protein
VHDIASAVDRNTQNNEDHNRDDFEQAEPIFELTVRSDGYDVDADQYHPEYQANGITWEVGVPVLDDQLHRRLSTHQTRNPKASRA